MNTDPTRIVNGPDDARLTLLLAHGAGQGMDSPFMETIASGLAAHGLRVVRFEFDYMQRARREKRRRPPDREPGLRRAFDERIQQLADEGLPATRLVIGGKSMGGRIASLIAEQTGVAGLVCLGYPFHPPGRPDTLRTVHLENLRTPTLICQGERDPFGRHEEVQRYPLSNRIELLWLPDGDHSFVPRKKAGFTEDENLRACVNAVAGFVAGLD